MNGGIDIRHVLFAILVVVLLCLGTIVVITRLFVHDLKECMQGIKDELHGLRADMRAVSRLLPPIEESPPSVRRTLPSRP